MSDRTQQLTLTLAVGADPIEGSIGAGANPPRPFCGWLELMAALDRAWEISPDRDPEQPHPQTSASGQGA